MCFVSAPVLSLLGILAFVWSAPALNTHGHRLLGPGLLPWTIAYPALNGVGLGLLVRALGAALRSVGETPPAWAPKAVGAFITWWILSIALPFALPSVVMDLPRDALSLVWVLTLAAFVLALASIMGRAARVLARQESPESALR